MNDVVIRNIKPGEIENLIPLCSLHAAYEKAPFDAKGKADKLRRYLFEENPALHCLVALKDGKMIGYASFMKQFSTWDADFYMYMDCLYLLEEFRGFGIGRQLINRIEEESQRLGITQIQWQTPNFNTRAMKFYDRLGGVSKSKERYFLECS